MGQSIDGFRSLFGTRSSSADGTKGQQWDAENDSFKHETEPGLPFLQFQAAAVAAIAAQEPKLSQEYVEILTHHPKTPD